MDKSRDSGGRPSLRFEAMVQKGPPPVVASTFAANTSRSMNMRGTTSRNRTISESAAQIPTQQQQRRRLDATASHAPLNLISSQMDRRETGTLIPIAQRVGGGSTPFGSAPTGHSVFGGNSMPVSSPRKMPQQLSFSSHQQQRHSPPSDTSEHLHHRFGDSPRSGSYNQNEMLDDLIIDEILSLEDEQRRSGRPMSVGFSDNAPTAPMSMARPIPSSSGGSGHSGSPITIGGNAMGNFRQFEVVSSSAPTSSIDIEQMMSGDGEEYYRDRRKKDIHNMIERRRRYNINDRIKELGQMLPKSSAEEICREMKLNKGTILKASCDYIRMLQKDRDSMVRQHQQAKTLESAAKQYADRVKELEEMLSQQGIHVPPSNLPPLPRFVERPIKQELDDLSPTNQTPSGSFSSGFLSEVTNNTAAMQIASPHGQRSFLNSAGSDSFFSVGSASPPDYSSQNNWKLPPNFPDLMMEDINPHQGTPLMNGGDPLISAAGAHPSPHLAASQMSPDIHWDGAGFSPDASGPASGGMHHHMDYS